MSTNKQDKAKQNLLKQIEQLSKINLKQQIQWLLRCWIVGLRQQTQTGFVLPTVVLVLLVVSLTVGALLFRSVSQTTQVIGQREQQKIYNAATPAIDRAKAKLEYLFTNGSLPSGVPSELQLATLMNATSYNFPGKTTTPYNQNETRLNLDGNTATTENAWMYRDANGNTIAYSILMKTASGTTVNVNSALPTKATNFVVRNGPLSGNQQVSAACATSGGGALEQGWFKDAASTAILRKNFQVNAVVLDTNNTALNKTAATLEFQQDRQLDRGNKWGAWFLNDLEIHPGPVFNWNGSLHSEGSITLGYNTSPSVFRAFLISSPNSCLYGTDGLDASEISMSIVNNPLTGAVTYQGQMIAGATQEDVFLNSGGARIDTTPTVTTTLGKGNDSVAQDSVSPSKTVVDITMDPLTLFTEEKQVARRTNDPSNTTARDSVWNTTNNLSNGATKRVFNKAVTKPYVDDTYRADNRYGPKLPPGGLPTATKVGDPISSTNTAFVSSNPISSNNANVGLDGYWERRARNEGLRIIVGERLELGNPLEVPNIVQPASPGATYRPHEALARRASRDNLAAVQATAIYFRDSTLGNLTNNAGDVPVACLATTVHPGTAATLRRGSTFEKLTYSINAAGTPVTTPKVFNDFFTGNGTNGWEYNFNYTTGSPSTAQLKALNNLANFAGDPLGAYPAQQEISTSTIVHPYPELTRNGNFSNLRRALASGAYADLSMADKSYIDTASCTLGMLADQIETLEAYNYTNNTGTATPVQQLDDLNTLLAPPAIVAGNPQAAIASATVTANPKLAQLARFVYLKEQVEWDRLAPAAANPGCALTGNLVKLCPTAQTPDSALYYIFPTAAHGERRTDAHIISAAVNNTPIANPNLYQAISLTELADISFTPRDTPATGNLDNLEVTSTTDPVNGGTYLANANVPNHRQYGLIEYIDRYPTIPVNTVYRIPFKDTALFNGRELMNVRVLNIDLDLLRTTTSPVAADTWLPTSGLIYAFREDGVREDGIARPALGTWDAYKAVWAASIPTYGPPAILAGSPSRVWRMNVVTPKDPPVNGFLDTGVGLTNGTGISPKSVDFYPDPSRRPHGFRLKEGANLLRTSVNNTNGLSFISDNPAYIQGDFNLHQNSSRVRLEEFTSLLTDNYSNFYNRTVAQRDPSFAQAASDSWRPTEILVDAITILPEVFCDGSLEDGFPTSTTLANTIPSAQYGCASTAIPTSYLNQNRATGNSTAWLRENTSDSASPIVVDRNGSPRTGTAFPGTPYSGNYEIIETNVSGYNPSIQPPLNVDTFVNAILVSGSVPSRRFQGYGGLHNYPRFISKWADRKLYISGSFIQLKFSNYATAPWDQDAYENIGPNADPDTGETLPHYEAPLRRWGYDVALQYQPPGAIAQRFTTLSSNRSEFYKELPVDDPYIKKLRCATIGATTTKVDLNATCP